jgi:hypothetical protein
VKLTCSGFPTISNKVYRELTLCPGDVSYVDTTAQKLDLLGIAYQEEGNSLNPLQHPAQGRVLGGALLLVKHCFIGLERVGYGLPSKLTERIQRCADQKQPIEIITLSNCPRLIWFTQCVPIGHRLTRLDLLHPPTQQLRPSDPGLLSPGRRS